MHDCVNICVGEMWRRVCIRMCVFISTLKAKKQGIEMSDHYRTLTVQSKQMAVVDRLSTDVTLHSPDPSNTVLPPCWSRVAL